ncbi:MAG: 5-formyltetrahydrofolate cyclo-ligase, partial [Colwellia sp.]
NRLGMGGGFYDRTLATWHMQYQHNKQTKPIPIGLAHDCQKVQSVPRETWDIPLPKIITPTTSYNFDI